MREWVTLLLLTRDAKWTGWLSMQHSIDPAPTHAPAPPFNTHTVQETLPLASLDNLTSTRHPSTRHKHTPPLQSSPITPHRPPPLPCSSPHSHESRVDCRARPVPSECGLPGQTEARHPDKDLLLHPHQPFHSFKDLAVSSSSLHNV